MKPTSEQSYNCRLLLSSNLLKSSLGAFLSCWIGSSAVSSFASEVQDSLVVQFDVNSDGKPDELIFSPNFDPVTKERALWVKLWGQSETRVFLVSDAEQMLDDLTAQGLTFSTSDQSLPFIGFDRNTEALANRDAPTPLTWDKMNALQRHISFFDLDQNQWITFGETYQGMRDLGSNPALAMAASFAIQTAMSTPTAGFPSLCIDLRNIGAGIHGSDSGLYDSDGNFLADRFDAWFERWDGDADGAFNLKELTGRWYYETDLFDFFGAFASGGEYAALYVLAAEDGKVSKLRMRGVFDGGLFYQLALARGTLGTRVMPEGVTG